MGWQGAVRLGFHVPVSRGLVHAARHARAIGCECLQVFVRNPRGWRARSYPEAEVQAFRELVVELKLGPLVVHSCYLANLASPNAELLARSRAAVADDLARAGRLGAAVVCVHAGHHMGAGPEAGLATLADSVRGLLDLSPPGVGLLLENGAQRGRELGSEWGQLARVLALTGGDERLGVCFDTCHAHAAGYRLDGPRRVGRTLREVERTVGLDRVRLIHLNDCRSAPGSGRDRHEHLGKGSIGAVGLSALLRRPELQRLCAILETPIARADDDARNLRRARRLMVRPRGRRRSGVGA